jgi:hypothetical protein
MYLSSSALIRAASAAALAASRAASSASALAIASAAWPVCERNGNGCHYIKEIKELTTRTLCRLYLDFMSRNSTEKVYTDEVSDDGEFVPEFLQIPLLLIVLEIIYSNTCMQYSFYKFSIRKNSYESSSLYKFSIRKNSYAHLK